MAARRYDTFWHTGDGRYAKAALSPDFIDHTLPKGRAQGPEGPLAGSSALRIAGPDGHLEDNLTLLQQLGVVTL